MRQYRETPRETEMLRLLAQGRVDVSPLSLVGVKAESSCRRTGTRPDAELVLRWQKKAYRFAVECKADSTPKQIAAAVEAANGASKLGRNYPLVLAPFLSERQLKVLEQQQVSGIDLSGNALILVPGELLVYRTGSPNQFRRSGVIKNVYRKNSSLVARVFLLESQFDSINQVRDEIAARGGNVAQATVSKVCSILDQDLVIERTRGESPRTRSLRLLQSDKLLELLAANYDPPLVKRRLTAKVFLVPDQLRQVLRQWAEERGERVVLTGASSVGAYAVMAREPIESFHCTNIDSLLERLGSQVDTASRFPSIELLETDDDFVYFDVRENLVASPVQTYLELMRGDKRERETALQVRKTILEPLE